MQRVERACGTLKRGLDPRLVSVGASDRIDAQPVLSVPSLRREGSAGQAPFDTLPNTGDDLTRIRLAQSLTQERCAIAGRRKAVRHRAAVHRAVDAAVMLRRHHYSPTLPCMIPPLAKIVVAGGQVADSVARQKHHDVGNLVWLPPYGRAELRRSAWSAMPGHSWWTG